MILVENLVKSFSTHKVVDRISFSVHSGETLGLLGPNGAGKTTTIRMLTGLVRPSSGTITVGGYNVLQNPIDAKRLFGYEAVDRPSGESPTAPAATGHP